MISSPAASRSMMGCGRMLSSRAFDLARSSSSSCVSLDRSSDVVSRISSIWRMFDSVRVSFFSSRRFSLSRSRRRDSWRGRSANPSTPLSLAEQDGHHRLLMELAGPRTARSDLPVTVEPEERQLPELVSCDIHLRPDLRPEEYPTDQAREEEPGLGRGARRERLHRLLYGGPSAVEDLVAH